MVEIAHGADAWYEAGDPPTPDAMPYWLMCGSAVIEAMWVTPDDIVDYDQIARQEAERYVETVLGPGMTVEVNPPEFAVTGIATWSWVEGWDGAPIGVPPINPFGDSIDVTLSLESATWDFGDGSPAVSGDLGEAYPAESSVQHVYTDRSTSAALPDGAYEVSATVTIGVSYRVNGGPEIEVTPPLSTTISEPVVVRQVQAVLS